MLYCETFTTWSWWWPFQISFITYKSENWENSMLSCPVSVQFSSVQSLSRVWLFANQWTAARQASLSITDSWSPPKPMSIESVMPTILSSAVPFSFCPQSFPASVSFPMSQLFTSGGQSIGVSASALSINIQDWFPLEWTGLISLQSKQLSRVFSNTTVQKHQFSGAQFCLWSNSHIHTWLLEKPSFEYKDLCQQSNVSAF